MVLGDTVTKLQRFVWIFNHVSRVITWSLFNFRAPNLSKKLVQKTHDLSYGGVSLSISLNLKVAPVKFPTNSEMANSASLLFIPIEHADDLNKVFLELLWA